MVTLFTIGFAKKSASEFFNLLKKADVRTILDVRLNATSQLAGFTKKKDLEYFLKVILDCSYCQLQELAPTKEILDAYHDKKLSWDDYEAMFVGLLEKRNLPALLDRQRLDNACLLCAESTADKCHRRLVAEKIQTIYPDITVCHL